MVVEAGILGGNERTGEVGGDVLEADVDAVLGVEAGELGSVAVQKDCVLGQRRIQGEVLGQLLPVVDGGAGCLGQGPGDRDREGSQCGGRQCKGTGP